MFDELKSYVGFGKADEQALRKLHGVAAPHFARIADVFYERILSHSGARQALESESQVGRLKVTLVAWMDTLLTGPWDHDYYERRARIGRVHVRIGLPQHYMFGAMNIVRQQLNAVVDSSLLGDPKELAAARAALGKILDLELAIMLHTYREDMLSQQSKAERLSTFGKLVGSIGHELRNPLGVIETSLYILKSRVPGDERAQKHIARINQQVEIANGIITHLLDMIRERPLLRETVKLGDVMAQSGSAITFPAEVNLQIQGVDNLPPVSGDPLQLRQVFVNLLENAVYASSPHGEVRVVGTGHDGHVEIAVEDTGPGVDKSIRARLFEPLVTTKAKGIGLGLSLVKQIVERHGGKIGYQDRTNGGARFIVQLPVRA